MNTISEFLDNKTVFITGATGFVGMGVVEKILRHASGIHRIYLMIRPRRMSNGTQITAEERLNQEVPQFSVFSKLRSELGSGFDRVMQEKLVAVSGDLTLDGLGIDPTLYGTMTREVDIVINCAGVVTFDEPLDQALAQNTLGAKRVVEFARACRDTVLIHVSTAYVNGQQEGFISEELCLPDRTIAERLGNGRAPDYELESEIAAIQAFSEDVEAASHGPELQVQFRRMLDRQDRGKRVTEHRRTHQMEALRLRWKRKQLADRGRDRGRELGWHDGYTMTKAMGEQMVVKTRGDVPTLIVRPSIIESSLRQPEPGWLDGLKVADPLIAHYSKGRLPDFPADPDVVLDIVPVDIVINAIVASLPKVRQYKDIQVYHIATGSQNPLYVREIFNLVYEYFKHNPMVDREGNPIPVRPWRFRTLKQFYRRFRYRHQLPLKTVKWVIDHVPLPWPVRFKRRVSFLDAMLENAWSLCEMYSSYTHLNCEFQTDNMRRLQAEMTPEDQEIFNCDVSRIHWPDYVKKIHIPGLKRHVLKTGGSSET